MGTDVPRIFYGWVVLACVSLVLLLTYGMQYSFGVFFTAMLPDLGWSRASLASAFSLYSFVYIGLSLASGHLTDRLGPRWVIAFGGCCLGSGMLLVSRMHAPWQFYLFYGVLAGIGMSAAYVPCTATAVKWFRHRRGLAVGIAGGGASLGIAGVPPLSEALLARFGWREIYVLFGIIVLVLLNVLAAFVVRDPEALGLQPDGVRRHAPPAAIEASGTADTAAWTFGEAVRTRTFWLLTGVMVLSLLTIPAVYVHLPQYARDLQLPVPRARFIMLIGLGALLGNVILGWLADRCGRRWVFGLSLILGALALGGMTAARGVPLLTVAAACFGVYYGTFASLFPAVMSDCFGRRHVGVLTGCSFALGSVTSALGPVVMGWVADQTGHYTVAFLGGAVVNSLVVLLFTLVRPPVRSA
jgi:MFS transporter, OFA family, oxalate/formate antiporter